MMMMMKKKKKKVSRRRRQEEGCYNDDVDDDERDRSLRFEKGRLYFHGVCLCLCLWKFLVG
jgi:hypothetical protein